MSKRQDKLLNNIYNLEDFPVFNYWDFNAKKFIPRKLNKLSMNFLNYLAIELDGLKEVTVESVSDVFINAVIYSYFGNASYEALGHPEFGDVACCGGWGSIEEQFSSWATGITVEEYRKDKKDWAYSEVRNRPQVVLDFIENSELFKLVSKKNKKSKDRGK